MTYVRRVVDEDCPVLLPMARAFHSESPVHRDLSFNEVKVAQLIDAALHDPAWLAAVAQDGDDIVGVALFYCLPEFYSDDLVAGEFAFYVTPAARGGRAAVTLLRYVREWAERQGAKKLRISPHTGIAHEATVRFFRRMGFEVVGSITSLTL